MLSLHILVVQPSGNSAGNSIPSAKSTAAGDQHHAYALHRGSVTAQHERDNLSMHAWSDGSSVTSGGEVKNDAKSGGGWPSIILSNSSYSTPMLQSFPHLTPFSYLYANTPSHSRSSIFSIPTLTPTLSPSLQQSSTQPPFNQSKSKSQSSPNQQQHQKWPVDSPKWSDFQEHFVRFIAETESPYSTYLQAFWMGMDTMPLV